MELINPLGAVVLVVCALVKIEPDLGTTIAIVLMVCGVLVVAGTPFRLFLSVTIPALVVVTYTVIREPYQMQRITTFLDPQKDPQATGLPGDPGDVRAGQRRAGPVSDWATGRRRATRRRRRRT